MLKKQYVLCVPTLYLEGDPVATATCAYWLIGLLYPTADIGLCLMRGELFPLKFSVTHQSVIHYLRK